jgi:hypothetical protein
MESLWRTYARSPNACPPEMDRMTFYLTFVQHATRDALHWVSAIDKAEWFRTLYPFVLGVAAIVTILGLLSHSGRQPRSVSRYIRIDTRSTEDEGVLTLVSTVRLLPNPYDAYISSVRLTQLQRRYPNGSWIISPVEHAVITPTEDVCVPAAGCATWTLTVNELDLVHGFERVRKKHRDRLARDYARTPLGERCVLFARGAKIAQIRADFPFYGVGPITACRNIRMDAPTSIADLLPARKEAADLPMSPRRGGFRRIAAALLDDRSIAIAVELSLATGGIIAGKKIRLPLEDPLPMRLLHAVTDSRTLTFLRQFRSGNTT